MKKIFITILLACTIVFMAEAASARTLCFEGFTLIRSDGSWEGTSAIRRKEYCNSAHTCVVMENIYQNVFCHDVTAIHGYWWNDMPGNVIHQWYVHNWYDSAATHSSSKSLSRSATRGVTYSGWEAVEHKTHDPYYVNYEAYDNNIRYSPQDYQNKRFLRIKWYWPGGDGPHTGYYYCNAGIAY